MNDTTNITQTERLIDKYSGRIYDALEAMAESLKIPVEHVYNILVKQQIVEAVIYIIVLVSGIACFFYFLICLSRGSKASNDSNAEVMFLVKAIIFGFFSFVFLFVGFCHLDTIVMGLINPEYGAIKDIMEFIK